MPAAIGTDGLRRDRGWHSGCPTWDSRNLSWRKAMPRNYRAVIAVPTDLVRLGHRLAGLHQVLAAMQAEQADHRGKDQGQRRRLRHG